MCVAECSFDIVVPQELLDKFDISPCFVQVRGVAMPQAVESDIL